MIRQGVLCFVVVTALGCSAPIQHGLEEGAANEMLTSLERAGISARKSRDDDGAFTVRVARADVVGAIEHLRTQGLPRGKRLGLGDVYKQPSLIPTQTEERARYAEALAGDVSRTLENVDGVALARVHLVLPELDALSADGKPRVAAQAAVLLKTRPGQPVPISEADVQKLVAASVPGLLPAAVSVVVAPAVAAPAGRQSGLVALGPLRMTADSRNLLLAGAAALFALLAALAVLVLVLARRVAAAQARREPGP
ncbi:MAG: secretion protein [Deltaproteobacteria bacterium]|nr:secretion protein [Deltaproteobacteria bacterium]